MRLWVWMLSVWAVFLVSGCTTNIELAATALKKYSKSQDEETSPQPIDAQIIVKSDIPSSGAPLSLTNRPPSPHPLSLPFSLKIRRPFLLS